MERFIFKEPAEKKVGKIILISTTTLIFLIALLIIVIVVFGVHDTTLIPFLIVLLIVYYFALIIYLRKKVFYTNIYELTPQKISRTNIKTNKKETFYLSDISTVENDHIVYKNNDLEYLQIRFKNCSVHFTIQPTPDDLKSFSDFSYFKQLFYRYLKEQNWSPNEK